MTQFIDLSVSGHGEENAAPAFPFEGLHGVGHNTVKEQSRGKGVHANIVPPTRDQMSFSPTGPSSYWTGGCEEVRAQGFLDPESTHPVIPQRKQHGRTLVIRVRVHRGCVIVI